MISDSSILSFERVGKTYISDFKRTKTVALLDLSVSVQKGEVFGIVGPNGAGKSTSLKILMGFIKHDTGTVTLSGHQPADPAAHRLVGYLPENPCLYEHLTPKEHLKFAGRVSGLSVRETAERTEMLLDLVRLSDASDKYVRQFSKGMIQRAALAYALFHAPEVLILDEPMSGLDPMGRQLVVDIIEDYHKRGNTILFCSHILTDVERICDRIGIMKNGSLASITTPEELGKKYSASKRGSKSPLETLFMETVQSNASE